MGHSTVYAACMSDLSSQLDHETIPTFHKCFLVIIVLFSSDEKHSGKHNLVLMQASFLITQYRSSRILHLHQSWENQTSSNRQPCLSPNIKENGVYPVNSLTLALLCQTQFLQVLVPLNWKLISPGREHIQQSVTKSDGLTERFNKSMH